MNKETSWFTGDVKPVRVGIYHRISLGDVVYSKWDGNMWLLDSRDINYASSEKRVSADQNVPWRGLLKETKK